MTKTTPPEPDPQRCPGIDALEAFERGGAEARVSDHIRACPRCRARLGGVRDNLALLAEVRATHSQTTGPASGGGEPPRAAGGGGGAPAPGPALFAQDGIPGYQLIEEWRRGGQGVVYRAIQTATKREVALKVLLHGVLATSAQRRRFEREVELAAALTHPNIVTVHDGGATADGRCFLAMELIEGADLAAHAADACARSTSPRETLRALLRLFVQVCDGVAYSHQHGVIHRDLKPANILVRRDGVPVIVDFGLAKAPASEVDAVTRVGEFGGSVAYASPEHFAADADAVDTRSDVYSLGVILYGVLAGRPPYPLDRGLAEAIESITRREPAPLAARRESAPGWPLDRDLAAITLRALEKAKERRYQSAGELGRDLRRYLAGEPVGARTPGPLERLVKFVRRRRLLSGAVAAVLVALTVGGVGVAWQAQRAARQARRTENMLNFLIGALTSADPYTSLRRVDTIGDFLDAATGKAHSEFADDPDALAALLYILGGAYSGQGRYSEALTMLRESADLRRALGAARRFELTESLAALGLLSDRLGDYAHAEAAFREALAARRALLGDRSPRVAEMLNKLARTLRNAERGSEARPLFEEAIAIRRAQRGDPVARSNDLGYTLLHYAALLVDLGDLNQADAALAEAEENLRRALDADHPQLAELWAVRAHLLRGRGDLPAALGWLERSLAALAARVGEDHPNTARVRFQLGEALADTGRTEAAIAALRAALETQAARLPAGHPDTARTRARLNQLAPDSASP